MAFHLPTRVVGALLVLVASAAACSFGVDVDPLFSGSANASDGGAPLDVSLHADADVPGDGRDGSADTGADSDAGNAPTCPLPSLVSNGGFEVGSTGWSAYAASTTVAIGSARSGSAGLRVCFNSMGNPYEDHGPST
jgi:hypothetical protein